MSNILVIGGAGYIGGALSDIMDVDILDNLLFEDRYFKNNKFIYADVRDLSELNKHVHKYDTLVVLAGLVGDPACAVDIELTQDINIKHVKWLKENYKGKIIYMSSCSVYGKNDNILTEDDPIHPLSVYAASKVEAEKILADYPDVLIYRLGTLYGIGDRFSRPRLDLVVNILTLKAVMGESLHVFGGDQWRPIINVRDVALAIKYGIENNLNGIFNIAERNIKIIDLAKEIIKIVPGEINQTEVLFEDKRNYKVNSEKIVKTGWAPEFSLQDGIISLTEVFKENRIKDAALNLYHNGNFMRKHYGT